MKQPQKATLTRAAKVLIDLSEFELAGALMTLIKESPPPPDLSVVTAPSAPSTS